MCKLSLLLACVAVVLPVMVMSMEEISVKKILDMEEQWTLWKKNFAKSYSPREELRRRDTFFKKLIQIEEHNSKYPIHVTFTLGLNKFSDLTVEEYREYNKLNKTQPKKKDGSGSIFMPPLNYQLPASVDWRTEGYVTPIKNQGECGSCWAFSTTGSVEGQHFRKTGTLLSLSEQQLVDCSSQNYGCNGGLMDQAFQYIMSQDNGLETELDYPYMAHQDACTSVPSEEVSPITGYQDITSGSEDDLQAATASVGPISVAIDASQASFQLYSGGVYYEPSCSSYQLDHGVLVVGYGTYQGQDYWLVKNSWGTNWGMEGYIMMARNQNNNCGIATAASYPTV